MTIANMQIMMFSNLTVSLEDLLKVLGNSCHTFTTEEVKCKPMFDIINYFEIIIR